jgi:hypothetical protein
MFKALIDTCVWLDLAKDRRQAPLLDLIDEMIRLEMLGRKTGDRKDDTYIFMVQR